MHIIFVASLLGTIYFIFLSMQPKVKQLAHFYGYLQLARLTAEREGGAKRVSEGEKEGAF